MAFIMIVFPILMALAALAVPSNRLRPWLLPITAAVHSALSASALINPQQASGAGWFVLDPPGRVVLFVVSTLYLFCSFYTVGYLKYRMERSNGVFCACFLGFPSIMSVVVWSHHLGMMWVAIEALTLVTAPLIYFNRTPRSIEATWKYLIVGSVGIALALLGTFFLAYACLQGGLHATLAFEDILANAPRLSKPWLHAAFILLLVGYGTKMGLAPMHTWKPEVYGEVPGVVGAIFAGGVTSCAFLAVMRIYQICVAAGEGAYISRLLVFMGLFSMAVAGLFMIKQKDFKRMLAYSSVEHMGILILGLGIGGIAVYGTLLHIMMNAFTKGVLFLSSGNIHRAYDSKNTDAVSGAMRRLPISGTLFLISFLAITGSPPFGPFISEFTILTGAFTSGRFASGIIFLAMLLMVFIGMGATVLSVVQGKVPQQASATAYKDGILTAAPAVILILIVLIAGLYIPAPLDNLIKQAVSFLEGNV